MPPRNGPWSDYFAPHIAGSHPSSGIFITVNLFRPSDMRMTTSLDSRLSSQQFVPLRKDSDQVVAMSPTLTFLYIQHEQNEI